MKLFRSDPLTEREKAYLRRVNGTMAPHSMAQGPKPADKPKVHEFTAPTSIMFGKRFRRGTSGCRLNPATRAIVQSRANARAETRAALQAIIDGSKRDMPI